MRLTLALVASLAAMQVAAQSYPAKPITVINTQAAGGPTDVTFRFIGSKMSETIGQPVVIESRPGAGGTVAALYVKSAAPDGYTVLLGSFATLAVNASLVKDLPYDPAKDFSAVTLLWSSPTLVVVPANSPAKTIPDLMGMIRKAPEAVSYASSGFGTTGHLGGSMIAAAAGQPMVHVPYKGSNDILKDLLAGRLDMYIGSYASFAPYYRAGKLRLLASVTAKRNPVVPDVPTMIELGYPDIHFDGWFGIVAPLKTPAPIVQRLHDELVKAANAPEVVAKFTEQGTIPLTSASPAEFAGFIANEVPRLARVVKISGAKAE